jgi:hypothetical protein
MRIIRTATVEGSRLLLHKPRDQPIGCGAACNGSQVLETRDSQKANSNIIDALFSFSSYMHNTCGVIVNYSGAFISRSTSSVPRPDSIDEGHDVIAPFGSLLKWHSILYPLPSTIRVTMVLEIPRRKFFRTINSKYIYGRIVSRSQQSLSSVVCDILSTVADSKIRRLVLIHFSLQPLVHTVIVLIEMAIIGRLVAKFNSYYADRPGSIRLPSTIMWCWFLQCLRWWLPTQCWEE